MSLFSLDFAAVVFIVKGLLGEFFLVLLFVFFSNFNVIK